MKHRLREGNGSMEAHQKRWAYRTTQNKAPEGKPSGALKMQRGRLFFWNGVAHAGYGTDQTATRAISELAPQPAYPAPEIL